MTSHPTPMIRRLLSTALVVAIATPALAQRADFTWEKALPAGNDVRMDLQVAVPTNLRVSASSVSGDVSVDGAHGDVDANSVSGDIRLDRLHATGVHANSVSGDIEVGVDEFTGRGDLYFHSVSGDVTLTVPRGFDADLSMSTVSGDIDSDFPITVGNGRMSRRRLEARIGNGGRRLDVGTVSGDLKLRQSK